MILSLLVAADEGGVIGNANQLPWHLPNDLKYFKNLTWAMPILMGRKTFESIGKPLPGRKSIVITRNNEWKHEGVTMVYNINQAIEEAKSFGVKEIFIIGGAQIFQSSMETANRIYLTRIHHHFEGDVFLPAIDDKEWKKVKSTYCAPDEKNVYPHTFEVWERNKK